MDEEEKDIELDKENLDDSVVAEEHAQESISKLKSKFKDAEDKAKEYLDGWQRSQADFVNLRRRDEESKIEFVKFANESFLAELIPVLDSFDLALSHGHKDLEPVYKQLLSILKSHGLEALNPAGEIFDPKLHESIDVLEVDSEDEDHKILEIIQKGYILSGKIIRPAKVKIGEYIIKNKK